VQRLREYMPTRNRPENALISLFLSAYENDTWKDCGKDPLDEKQDRAVELLATRLSDGATLAIEHTLIQPYGAYKQEFSRFRKVFFRVQNDQTLIVRSRGIDVFVASGTLKEGFEWASIAGAVHSWLRGSVHALPVGESNHVVEPAGKHPCRLLIRVQDVPDYDGDFRIGIDGSQLPAGALSSVVEKALEKKLPKLAGTQADNRILMLERDESTLSEDLIAGEIENMRHRFVELSRIGEIWFADTVLAPSYVRFSVRGQGRAIKLMAFHNRRLHRRYNG
jgi:hypothetical protein